MDDEGEGRVDDGRANAPITTGDTALVPVREQRVDFNGDSIPVAQAPDGTPYVALRPITDYLGLAFSPQRRRVLRDEVLAARLRTILMTAADGRRREVLCLPLDLLPGWLFGVTPSQARPEVVDKLKRYRADCFRVLWEAFKGEAAHPVSTDTETEADTRVAPSGAALALEIATAVQHLARNQLEIEGRLADVAGRQDMMADYLRGFIVDTHQRLHALEQATATEVTINEAQAAEIALAVKAVGQRLEAGGDREGYAKVYAALYRRYSISTYKALPAARFPAVRDWLHAWYEEVAGEG